MTDIDGSTGEVIENLPVTTSDPWKDRLQDSYRKMAEKTVPAILEFAAEVKAFKDDCTERKQGGSTFDTMAKLWLNMSHAGVQQWLQIGKCAKLVSSANLLPSSWHTVYLLTTLPPRKFTDCIRDGRINPLMTRAQAKELKPASTRKSPISKIREAEDLYQERLKKIVNVFATMSQEDMVRTIEELNNYVVKIGESNE